MKIIDLEQGSDEWKLFRRSRIGASDTAAVMGQSIYKTPRMLWNDKINGAEQFVSEAMKFGTAHENEVRQYVAEKEFKNLIPLVATHDENDWQFASFDAIDQESKVFYEIKCPQKNAWDKFCNDKIPSDWLWQVQKQIYISGYDFGTLVVKNPTNSGDFISTMIIPRDDVMIANLVKAESKFYKDYMKNFVEPPFLDADIPERKDAAWTLAALEANKCNLALVEAQRQSDAAKEMLIKLANGSPCRGSGACLTKVSRQGTVDYAQIPELKNIDLDFYRKAQTSYWKLSIS